jgi:hypothetical protein
MAKMEELLKRLSADKVEPVDEALDRKKGEWIDDIRKLLHQIRTWLASAEADGTVAIDETEIEIAEQDLGPYNVPALAIRVRTRNPSTIHVQPKGMRVVGVIAAGRHRIVGASGRVDVTSGPSRVILLRFTTDGTTRWKAILDDGTKEDLSRDSFATALEYLLNIDE